VFYTAGRDNNLIYGPVLYDVMYRPGAVHALPDRVRGDCRRFVTNTDIISLSTGRPRRWDLFAAGRVGLHSTVSETWTEFVVKPCLGRAGNTTFFFSPSVGRTRARHAVFHPSTDLHKARYCYLRRYNIYTHTRARVYMTCAFFYYVIILARRPTV